MAKFKVGDKGVAKNTTPRIIITADGRKTTAKLMEGKETIKTANAVCSDEDVFDFRVGAAVAFDRLLGRKTPEIDLRRYLRDGVFGLASKEGLFVVINGYIIYKNGGFDFANSFSHNLTQHCGNKISYICDAVSFENAELIIKNNDRSGIIWKRR